MKLDDNLLKRIRNIKWFENCGMPVNTEIGVPITYLASWDAAKIAYENPDWEDITLEAQNELSVFLYGKFQNEYSNWNHLVKAAKSFMVAEVTPKIEVIREVNNLDQSFIGNIEWVILHAIMEDAYKKSNHKVSFFLDLLGIYESGNFPCGLGKALTHTPFGLDGERSNFPHGVDWEVSQGTILVY